MKRNKGNLIGEGEEWQTTEKRILAYRTVTFVGSLLFVILLVAAQTANAQLRAHPAKEGSAPPPNWIELFNGFWGDSENHVPPGYPPYSTLNPFRTIGADVIAPLLQPWAAARKADMIFEIEETGYFCRPTGLLMGHQNRGFQMVALPDRIIMIGTQIHNRAIRRIYVDRGHLVNPPLTSFGDSVGSWNGDTFIVDTIGFDDISVLDLDGGRHSTEMRIVERWRFVEDGNWLERRWTVDDPRALKAPFTFTRYHERLPVERRPDEGICLDEPDSWRAWVYIRNTAVQTFDERRTAAAKAASQGQQGSPEESQGEY